MNERRTRRGVYAIIQEQDDDSDESDDEEKEGNKPLANASDVAELDLEFGGGSSALRSMSRRSASRFVSIVSTDRILTLSSFQQLCPSYQSFRVGGRAENPAQVHGVASECICYCYPRSFREIVHACAI